MPDPTLQELQDSIEELEAYRNRLREDVISMGKKLKLPQKRIDATVAEHAELQRLEEVLEQLLKQKDIMTSARTMGLFEPPMSMAQFLEASRGTWLNRRSIHHLDHQDDEAADSNLVIEPFDASDPVVQKVCDALQVEASRSNGGGRFWWESNLKQGSRNDDYAAVIVDVPADNDSRRGFLLRDVGYVEKKAVISTYSFADDGVLTITTRYDTNVGTERCWFVTDQVRMRVSSVQCLNGVSMTTYCTELRCPSDDDIKALAQKARLFANSTAMEPTH